MPSAWATRRASQSNDTLAVETEQLPMGAINRRPSHGHRPNLPRYRSAVARRFCFESNEGSNSQLLRTERVEAEIADLSRPVPSGLHVARIPLDVEGYALCFLKKGGPAMWITLTACFACFAIGGYAGHYLGYRDGREEIQDELRDLLTSRWPIAEGQPRQ